MGAPAQFGDGSARQPAAPTTNSGAMKIDRPRSGALGAAGGNVGGTPLKTRSGADACQNPLDVDGCRRQCADAPASSPQCPPPTTFDYCGVNSASAVCQQLCQQMNGQYSPACPNAPKPPMTASQGGEVGSGATATASDLCAPPPQGKGAASPECERMCDRNPGYSAFCTRGATPPAGAGPVVGSMPAPAGSGPAAGGNPPPASGGASAAASRGPTMAVAPALAPQASSTLPGSQPPSRRDPNATVARLGCGPHLAMGGDPYFASVDGQARGVVFTPGRTYTIQGCGFGERKGSVALNGSSGGMSNLALLIQQWSDSAIIVQVDPALSGVGDQKSVEVVVSRSDGRRLQQMGHAFEAAREVVKLTSLPPGLLARTSAGGVRPQPEVTSPAKSGATLEAFTSYQASAQFCPRTASTDTLQTSKLPLKPGFAIDRFDVRNLSDNTDRGPPIETRQQTDFLFRRQGSDLIVNPAWIQDYFVREITLGGSSTCRTRYEVDVYVKGPRGFSPL
ncbi:MAG: hypothetical protein N2688_02495 [Burkholderiaceae bacterium]|nr:hypothetical protein [Burkholderiaceae bacterium]